MRLKFTKDISGILFFRKMIAVSAPIKMVYMLYCIMYLHGSENFGTFQRGYHHTNIAVKMRSEKTEIVELH